MACFILSVSNLPPLPLVGSFMRRNGASILLRALGRYGSGDGKNAAALREACGALRSVTLGDDRRQDFSGYSDIFALKASVRLLPIYDGIKVKIELYDFPG